MKNCHAVYAKVICAEQETKDEQKHAKGSGAI